MAVILIATTMVWGASRSRRAQRRRTAPNVDRLPRGAIPFSCDASYADWYPGGGVSRMAFWWVNHKQTRDHEVRGGYLWSPMRNANGSFNQTYDKMTLVRPGDIVFSYANGQI